MQGQRCYQQVIFLPCQKYSGCKVSFLSRIVVAYVLLTNRSLHNKCTAVKISRAYFTRKQILSSCFTTATLQIWIYTNSKWTQLYIHDPSIFSHFSFMKIQKDIILYSESSAILTLGLMRNSAWREWGINRATCLHRCHNDVVKLVY